MKKKTIRLVVSCLVVVALLLASCTPAVEGEEEVAVVVEEEQVTVEGKIVFGSKRDGNWEIYVMNADGSNQQRLTDNPSDDVQLSWSP